MHIKKLMVEYEMTYEELVKRLEQRGVILSSSNLRNKVSGNALSAGLFFLMVELISGTLTLNMEIKA